MYGDAEVMRKRAAELREQALDLRGLADELVARTEATGWTGRAAEAMSERVRERAGHLRTAAGGHDTAADSLERHAQEVETLQERIADTERKVSSLVADARTRSARTATEDEGRTDSLRRLPGPDDRTLIDFEPPPSGHRDWLGVSLPGL